MDWGEVLLGLGTFSAAAVAYFGVRYQAKKSLASANRAQTHAEAQAEYANLQADLRAEREARTALAGEYRAGLASEQNTRIRQVEQLMEELASHKAQIVILQGDNRVRDDYIEVLRRHIQLEKNPPPPAYPREMLR